MNYITFPKSNGWFALIRLLIVPRLTQPPGLTEGATALLASRLGIILLVSHFEQQVVTSTVFARLNEIMAVNYPGLCLWGNSGGRERAERREWDGQTKKFKRVSVYWCASFSSQQEFFPCSIIAARLPTHKRPPREFDSPPDVISSTFIHDHFEEQHVFRCDGLDCARSMGHARSVMSTGLKGEVSSRMHAAPLHPLM